MKAIADIRKALRPIDECTWELPRDFKPGMRVPGAVFATEEMLETSQELQTIEQVANVASLPGIVSRSMAMPDFHWGYGFPIGGVAAMRVDDGVVSPGGVGFDINCGVRLLRSDLTEDEVRPHLKQLVAQLDEKVPSGVGSGGSIRLQGKALDQVMTGGAEWAVAQGYGDADDLEVTEDGGRLGDAGPDAVGQRPRQRGSDQLGTLGSGNHFLEVQAVEEIFHGTAAGAMGIDGPGQVVVMFHCGSRGFGHQICGDYVKEATQAMRAAGITVPDRQLACAPIGSKEGKAYLQAMACAANFAWANRQVIAHWTRQAFEAVFRRPWQDLGMRQVYDVSHNMAKIEEHRVDGRAVSLCVHRKGATRAFPPGRKEVSTRYREVGQPVLIPGDMGRYSYICVGGSGSLEKTWGSACHGAGRRHSRSAAKKMLQGRDLRSELEDRGIIARASGWASLAEEATEAYKDVADVVEVCQRADLAKKVVKLRPLGVVKG